jgi:hypothetical protein
MAPVMSFFVIASTGHASAQTGDSHCRQIAGLLWTKPSSSRSKTRILDFSGLAMPSLAIEQTTSQALHPVHLFLVKGGFSSIFFSPLVFSRLSLATVCS